VKEPRAEQYGILAEFADADQLVAAAARVHELGYRYVECYSPLPVEGAADAIGFHRTRMPLVVLCGGIVGGLCGLALQYWTTVIAYPLNIGGRPLFSWPSFVPVVFEMTVLVAALSAVLGMLAMNGLPQPHHPLFAVPGFARATQDRFFLSIRAQDPLFEPQQTRQVLEQLGGGEVVDVWR
jgi:Alternative complex III, ActD subunit